MRGGREQSAAWMFDCFGNLYSERTPEAPVDGAIAVHVGDLVAVTFDTLSRQLSFRLNGIPMKPVLFLKVTDQQLKQLCPAFDLYNQDDSIELL